jgi:hypothetical protein
VLHWTQSPWPSVPQLPTTLSLGVIAVTLATVTVTSMVANHRDTAREKAYTPKG